LLSEIILQIANTPDKFQTAFEPLSQLLNNLIERTIQGFR